MHDICQRRVAELQRRMADDRIDAFLLTDPDSVYYFTAYWGYLGMEFARPTMLFVPTSGSCTLITPAMEAEMARVMTWVGDIRTWHDGADWQWIRHLHDLLDEYKDLALAIERFHIHPVILDAVRSESPSATMSDGTHILADMRMIKRA